MKKSNVVLLAVLLGVILSLTSWASASEGAGQDKKQETPVVSQGKTVKVDYTLTVDGKEMDSSKGRGPLEFKVGEHKVIPGFEKAIIGMKVGEKKSFKVEPEEGYGDKHPEGVKEIPRNQLPPEITPKAGMTLSARGPNGQNIPVRIVEVKDDTVVLDFNHPLAGKTLNFDVEVVEIK